MSRKTLESPLNKSGAEREALNPVLCSFTAGEGAVRRHHPWGFPHLGWSRQAGGERLPAGQGMQEWAARAPTQRDSF